MALRRANHASAATHSPRATGSYAAIGALCATGSNAARVCVVGIGRARRRTHLVRLDRTLQSARFVRLDRMRRGFASWESGERGDALTSCDWIVRCNRRRLCERIECGDGVTSCDPCKRGDVRTSRDWIECRCRRTWCNWIECCRPRHATESSDKLGLRRASGSNAAMVLRRGNRASAVTCAR